MGWSIGSGKFSMSNAGNLSSAPTSRSMFLYTAAPCFGATIFLRNKSAQKLAVSPDLIAQAGQAERSFEVENSSGLHGHVSLLCALASIHDAAKLSRR